jgi:hypothetical protein
MSTLVPEYLSLDFETLKARFKNLLSTSPIFRDYNYEGNNITILIELVSYIGDLTTYFLNKIAKNQYMETADLFETVHMLARLRGYQAQGYRSSRTTLSVRISAGDIFPGETLYIPAWKKIECPTLTDSNGETIKFSTVTYTTHTIPATASMPYTIGIPVRQGAIETFNYTGGDLIDNKINLPLENFDYDDDLEDDNVSVEVNVNGTTRWDRIADFYDELNALVIVDTVYALRYDKYQRYVLEFSSSRDVPAVGDSIEIILLKTLGKDGNVAANTITYLEPAEEFMQNLSPSGGPIWVDNTTLTLSNSAASIGGSDPDTVDTIKSNSEGTLNSQKRNVTALDYQNHLEERSDVIKAHVWGEQEIAPSGSVLEYNKVHISVVPDIWGSGTITTTSPSAGVLAPAVFTDGYKTILATYLEPRKMLCAYEKFELPDLVYFQFDFGIKIKRTYNYASVATDVRAKLDYYFTSSLRSFNETISFTDIVDFIMDPTQVSDTSDFPQVAGIQNLIARDVRVITHTVYEPNTIGNYPQYTEVVSTYVGSNRLRRILLGLNQFPMLHLTGCVFSEES